MLKPKPKTVWKNTLYLSNNLTFIVVGYQWPMVVKGLTVFEYICSAKNAGSRQISAPGGTENLVPVGPCTATCHVGTNWKEWLFKVKRLNDKKKLNEEKKWYSFNRAVSHAAAVRRRRHE